MSILAKIFGLNDNIMKDPITAPTDNPEAQGPGFMRVDDVFSIKGRGTVATGRVVSGTFHVGQTVVVQTITGPITTTILGLEAFRKTLDYASAGENVGLLLRDIDRNAIQRNDTITAQ